MISIFEIFQFFGHYKIYIIKIFTEFARISIHKTKYLNLLSELKIVGKFGRRHCCIKI